MTPEEAQRLGGVVETLVVGKKLDQMESQLKAIEASGVRPMVTQAPESEKPTWGRGLEKVQGPGGQLGQSWAWTRCRSDGPLRGEACPKLW
jgi:hypothetical protein